MGFLPPKILRRITGSSVCFGSRRQAVALSLDEAQELPVSTTAT